MYAVCVEFTVLSDVIIDDVVFDICCHSTVLVISGEMWLDGRGCLVDELIYFLVMGGLTKCLVVVIRVGDSTAIPEKLEELYFTPFAVNVCRFLVTFSEFVFAVTVVVVNI